MSQPESRSQAGFTILEICVALAISTVLAAFVYQIFSTQGKLRVDEEQKVRLQQNGRAVISMLASGLRMAGFSPVASTVLTGSGVNAGSGIQQAQLQQCTYSWDRNENGLIENSEIISLSLTADGDLQRTIGSGASATPQTLVNNVAAFAILYAYDMQGPGSHGYGDLEPAGLPVWWAFSSTNNGLLDFYYEQETPQSSITFGNPINLPRAVPLRYIRGVKIWTLLRSNRSRMLDITSNTDFQIPFTDTGSASGIVDTSLLDSEFSYRLFTSSVRLRNMYY